MNKANECTCPSGDGSLVHPCPAHPAVEQAGTNVGHGHVFPRADGVKMRCGGPALCSECAADAYRARAALAQPSGEVVVTKNESGAIVSVTRQDKEGRVLSVIAESATLTAQAEKAEVVARVVHSNPVVLGQCGPLNANDELMTVAQHAASVARWAEMFNRVEQQRDAALAEVERLRQFERICEGLPQDAIDGGWTVQGIRGYAKRLEDQLKAALARVADMKTMADNYCALLMDANAKLAEMERQEPVALANRGLHAFWVKWTEAAAGLYGPGIKLYAAPVAQAQHSVPEGWKLVPSDKGCVTSSMKAECIGEFSFYIRAACAECLDVGTDSDCHVCGGDIEYDQKIDVPWDTCKEIYKTMLAAAPGKAQHSVPEVSGIGRDFAYPRSVVLYLRTEPTDDDLRAIHDGLRSLAAAPGKEGV